MTKIKDILCDYRVGGAADLLVLAGFLAFLLPTCIMCWVLAETILPAPGWGRD